MTNNIYLKTNLELIEYLNSRFSDESLFIIDSNLNNLKIDEQVNAQVSYFDINEETKNLTSVEKIWDLLFQHNLNRSSEIVIIGGGYLFKETLPVMNKLVITKVDCNVLGDIYYPKVEMENWKLVNSESYIKNSDNDYDFKIEEYEKL